jgi:hypothetical protein
VAEEAIDGHVSNVRISVDDVGQSSLFDLFDYVGGVSVFEPDSITIADVAELKTSDSGS